MGFYTREILGAPLTAKVIEVASTRTSLWLLFVVFLGGLLYRTRPTANLPLPPQPPAWPIIGHLPDLIRENKARRWHLKLNEWARVYGPIFGVRTGYIIDYYVNSDVMVKELFDKMSAQTADRPVWVMSSTIMNNDYNTLFLDASHPRWKNQRKVIQQLLTCVQQADKIVPLLEYETLRLLGGNVLDPSGGLSGTRLLRSIERYAYSAFGTAIMGMDVPKATDCVIDFIRETETQIINTFPGSNIIDLAPSLGRLPLFLKPWERTGRARYRRDLAWAMKRLQTVMERIEERELSWQDTFLGAALSHDAMRGLSCPEELAILSFALIVASADTSRMTTWSFVEAMMQFPEVQARAQAEIGKFTPENGHKAHVQKTATDLSPCADQVVGDRLPVYEDYARIPYVRMLLKEVWRWRPPVALGHPHITSRDTQVGEYFLPKGARIHINAYAISRDPLRHEDPDRFWPERFQDDETSTMESINSPDPTKRDHFAFGAGRRVCPGYHVAERSAVITMMRILWAFRIEPTPGTKTPLDFSDYASVLPGNPGEDMPVKFRYRSEGRKTTILIAIREAEASRAPSEPLNMGEKSFPDQSAFL